MIFNKRPRKERRSVAKPKSKKITITVREDYLEFIDEQIRLGNFEGRSHAMRLGIKSLMDEGVRT